MSDKKENCSKENCQCSENLEITEEKFWQDIHNKELDPELTKGEFKEGEFDSFSIIKNRRDFLKIMGFSFTMLPMAACTKSTVRKAIPYLEKNDVIIPGLANWYATTYAGVPLLVKTREGRPIKVEGNDKSIWFSGGADAVCQASILSLYDSYRLKNPLKDANIINWETLDKDLLEALQTAKKQNKKIALITNEIQSPSTMALLEEFKNTFGAVEHIAYSGGLSSPVSKSFDSDNTDVLFDFNKAKYVLSFNSDFLGVDKNAVAYSRQYAKAKNLENGNIPLKHVQVESLLTLAGSNADERYPLNQDEIKALLLLILGNLGGEDAKVSASLEVTKLSKKISADLQKFKNQSFVISNFTDLHFQKIVNKINFLIGAFSNTAMLVTSKYFKFSDDAKFELLIDSLLSSKNEYGALLFIDVNPVYSYRETERLTEALSRIHPKFSFVQSEDETSVLCEYNIPIHHNFESWDDNLFGRNELSVTQAVIQPLFKTRQWQDILLKTIGRSETFDGFMKLNWEKKFFQGQSKALTFNQFWIDSVHNGVVEASDLKSEVKFTAGNIQENVNALLKSINITNDESHFDLNLYEKIAIRDGRHANNPWLQELPDPITKVTWDNYISISPKIGKKLNISTGEMLEVSVGKKSLVLPALVQPGVASQTIGIAIGYGRTVAGKVGKDLGKNANVFKFFKDGAHSGAGSKVTIKKTGKTYELALTQTHHSLEGRDIIRETTFGAFAKNPKSGNENKTHIVTMWGKDKPQGHQWAMAIDLNKCNGCSACVVSCNAENNVPVVGRQEVLNRREMHWMRIDRYYKGHEDTPTVSHQPMTCHHCENAPCESVCPVLATVHSSEGINAQVYNRCVGTRYCANNCPYKVRRFNWFDYPHTDPNENMVLNPDVTVRSRGVMEKCSLCIQRIQEVKLEAKKEGREIRDGEIKLACQQSCPSEAIVFGDMSDPKSKISSILNDPRNFTVLEELNIKPRLSYLTKVRNRE